jgi:hypothetical protein
LYPPCEIPWLWAPGTAWLTGAGGSLTEAQELIMLMAEQHRGGCPRHAR